MLAKKRAGLTKKESQLLHEIEDSTTQLEHSLNKTLKATLLIGGGLLAGYAVYRAISGEKKKTNKTGGNKKQKVAEAKQQSNPILSFLLKNGLPLLIDVIKRRVKR
ncbi:MAG: hypothetical protein RIG77_02745 [Cyclobacteriaceae bacterium]